MAKLLLMFCCIAFSTACCMNKDQQDGDSAAGTAAPGTICTLFSDGKAVSAQPADTLGALALKLLESSTDQVLMMVTPEMLESIRSEGDALEAVFPDTLTVTGPTGVKHRIDRILIPLSGDYGPGDGLGSALILFGNKNYTSGPLMNAQAKADLTRIRELLGL